MKKSFITFFSLLAFSSFAQEVSEQVLKHLDNIDTNRIKAHVAYLSDDKLRGRLPGTPGYQMAVDYVAWKFKCPSLIIEFPFKDTIAADGTPDSLQPAGCIAYGRDCVDMIAGVMLGQKN